MVAIIDYNAGNITSVSYALDRLDVPYMLTRNPEQIMSADHVIFPGVGEASTTMRFLKDHQLHRLIQDLRQPVLGICLGMQLMCEWSEENNTDCLGIFPHKVIKFVPESNDQKTPHMGWNLVTPNGRSVLSSGDFYAYFVHSFYVEEGPWTVASCDYIIPFSAMLHKNNFYATQFHPERSGDDGERLLANFLKL